MSVFSSDIGGAATVDFGGGGGGFAGAPGPAGATNIGGLNRAYYGKGGALAKPINGPGYRVGVGPRPVRPQQTTGQIFGRSGEVFGRSAAISGRSATAARPALGGLGRVARTTLPGGSPNPNSGQGLRLPQVPSALPTARAPVGGLPGNPFGQRPQPFAPSGADRLPVLQYPNQLPIGAIGPGVSGAIQNNDPTAGGSTFITGVAIQFTRSTPRADTAPIPFSVTVSGRALSPEVVIGPPRPPGHRTVPSFIGFQVLVNGAVVFSSGNDTASASISNAVWTPPAGYVAPQPQPNLSRPQTPQPLPAPGPRPQNSPRPWPQLPRPRQPAQQLLPPTAPLPNLPQTAPLPDELAPPLNTPTGQPVTLPSGLPTGGSVAIGVPGGQLSGGRRVAPLAPGVAPLAPVRPAPLPSPGQVPLQITFGQPQPVFTPVENFSPQQGITPAIEVLPEPIFDKPPTKTENCTPDPDAKCRYDDKNIAGKCDDIHQILDENLAPIYSGNFEFRPCGQGASTFYQPGDTGLRGIDEKLDAVMNALNLVWDRVKCESDAIALVPEWWQVRSGAKRPQLLVMYREKLQDGTWGNARRQFSVPHFNVKMRPTLKSILPKDIKKGAYQGIYTLSDNSKMIQFCKSPTECERVLKALEQLILKNQRTDDIKVGEIKGNKKREFTTLTLYPYDARYYALGQGQGAYSWIEKFY